MSSTNHLRSTLSKRITLEIRNYPNDINEDENDKKMDVEVIEKLFRMMEKFTQQMLEMKETNNLK